MNISFYSKSEDRLARAVNVFVKVDVYAST